MAERPLIEWSDEDLLDAVAHVNSARYAERASLLDAEVQRRGLQAPRHHQLCGARIGWTYFDYPLASLALFTDRVVVRAIAGPSATIRLEHLTELRMTREIVATLLELVHSDNAPEVAVWVSDLGKLADKISRASGRILSGA